MHLPARLLLLPLAHLTTRALADIFIGQAVALDCSGTVGCFSITTIGIAPAQAFTCSNIQKFDAPPGVLAPEDAPESELFEFKLEDKFCGAGWVTFVVAAGGYNVVTDAGLVDSGHCVKDQSASTSCPISPFVTANGVSLWRCGTNVCSKYQARKRMLARNILAGRDKMTLV